MHAPLLVHTQRALPIIVIIASQISSLRSNLPTLIYLVSNKSSMHNSHLSLDQIFMKLNNQLINRGNTFLAMTAIPTTYDQHFLLIVVLMVPSFLMTLPPASHNDGLPHSTLPASFPSTCLHLTAPQESCILELTSALYLIASTWDIVMNTNLRPPNFLGPLQLFANKNIHEVCRWKHVMIIALISHS